MEYQDIIVERAEKPNAPWEKTAEEILHASFLLYLSNGRNEGLSAFRAKREPQFKGE